LSNYITLYYIVGLQQIDSSLNGRKVTLAEIKQDAVQLEGGLRDAAINFGTYR